MTQKTATASSETALESLLNQEVVVDVTGPFLYIGILQDFDQASISLVDADVHNLRDTNTGTEQYLIETKKHGIRVNRHKVVVMKRVIMSVSPLEAVETY